MPRPKIACNASRNFLVVNALIISSAGDTTVAGASTAIAFTAYNGLDPSG